MFGRWLRGVALLSAALVLACAPTLREPATAAPAASKPIHRIVAVGDLHGDFAAWRAIAQDAGLVDAKGRWAGGKTVLVQTGDIVDRGPQSLAIVQDLIRLQGEAKRAGGKVIVLVGNHEAMNLTDDLRYVVPADYAAFTDSKSEALRQQVYTANRKTIEAAYRAKDPALTDEAIKAAWLAATPLGMIEHQKAWHPTGKIGKWVVSNPAVVILDGTIFVHGGVSGEYSALPADKINQAVALALKTADKADGSIIHAEKGPLWYRGLTAGTPEAEAELGQVLQAYGARRIVIGHTPILSGVAIAYDGRLVRIDTGISVAYGGALGYLEILDGTLVPHSVARPGGPAAGAAQ